MDYEFLDDFFVSPDEGQMELVVSYRFFHILDCCKHYLIYYIEDIWHRVVVTLEIALIWFGQVGDSGSHIIAEPWPSRAQLLQCCSAADSAQHNDHNELQHFLWRCTSRKIANICLWLVAQKMALRNKFLVVTMQNYPLIFSKGVK